MWNKVYRKTISHEYLCVSVPGLVISPFDNKETDQSSLPTTVIVLNRMNQKGKLLVRNALLSLTWVSYAWNVFYHWLYGWHRNWSGLISIRIDHHEFTLFGLFTALNQQNNVICLLFTGFLEDRYREEILGAFFWENPNPDFRIRKPISRFSGQIHKRIMNS